MAAIPSNLTSLDFTEIRESIRSYLRTRDEFTDYDFDGSAASYLLDVLSYNTYYASFTANMAMNEAFLESATIRDNVVKIAKQLNYTPRSVKAPKGCVRFAVQTTVIGNSTDYPSSVTMIAGDVFVSTTAGQGYTFTLPENLVATVDQATGIATFTQVVIYQGNTLEYEYVVEDVKKRTYLVPSDAIDTDLLKVSISPNAQSEEIDTYNLVENIVDVDGTTRGYFLEETDDQRYNVVFGDGVICRQLIAGEVIKLKYVKTEGTAANGCKRFSFIGRIQDSTGRFVATSNVSLVTIDGAQDGEDLESTLSIKFNAPRAFNSQNRAVTESDYEYITKKVYPQAKAVTAYGGERLQPPVYGKVYISIRTKSGALLNTTTKKRIRTDLQKYSIAAIEPVIVDPITLFIRPKTWAFFDGNKTTLSNNEIASKVLGAIDQYNSQAESTRFNGRIDISAYQTMIDSSDPAISGNVTHMTLGMNVAGFNFGQTFTQCIDFGNEIANPNDLSGADKGGSGTGTDNGGTCTPKYSSVKSGTFYATGYTESLLALTGSTNGNQISSASLIENDTSAFLPVNIRDDGYGTLILVTKVDETETVLKKNVGTVDYKNGQVCLGPIDVASTPDGTNRIPVTVIPASSNIDVGPGLDPAIFNPTVQSIDYTIDTTNAKTFDPFDFTPINFDGSSINIIDYPTTVYEVPEFNSCF
tara:strand:- start:27532 stop:29625 length:2094 start_codon:yes stop_codon:yes gene_type:complete